MNRRVSLKFTDERLENGQFCLMENGVQILMTHPVLGIDHFL